ncbi:MAG: peptide transporter ATP-binding protein [Hydrocarboniphaga sp.]|uniref:ABC transporter ATP-binding protein n=1 Tax=Hydrocarboniphaga sp. TaxID=2033016 RepID=UPI0026288363|nr:ABC transporter ATP-binding protein [Hydrocarboniphaga sp.]MDB5968282.1 peptide transporter ATP-binding protein [Hydrocarboniphaga sp.]
MINLRRVSRAYSTPAGTFTALREIDLHIGRGEFVAVVGKSGSGKSTLLNLLGGIDRPSAGALEIAGTPIQVMSENQLAKWRGAAVGIVFQFFQLLPTLSVIENVMLPMDFLRRRPVRERRSHALALLDRVGVADQADKLPAALSGGQQQRTALARALANEPPLLIADEPTGNLDSVTAAEILTLFRKLADAGTTVVIATHDRDILRLSDRALVLADGVLVPGQ